MLLNIFVQIVNAGLQVYLALLFYSSFSKRKCPVSVLLAAAVGAAAVMAAGLYFFRGKPIVYDSYQKILNYLVSPSVNMEELCLNVTVRGCIGALECIEEEATPKQALMETLVGAIGAKELDLARDIERDIINSLPNISV